MNCQGRTDKGKDTKIDINGPDTSITLVVRDHRSALENLQGSAQEGSAKLEKTIDPLEELGDLPQGNLPPLILE